MRSALRSQDGYYGNKVCYGPFTVLIRPYKVLVPCTVVQKKLFKKLRFSRSPPPRGVGAKLKEMAQRVYFVHHFKKKLYDMFASAFQRGTLRGQLRYPRTVYLSVLKRPLSVYLSVEVPTVPQKPTPRGGRSPHTEP